MTMTASCVNPMSLSVMRETKNSFFNPSVRSLKQNKVRDLKNKLEIFLNHKNDLGIDKMIENSYNGLLVEYNWEKITGNIINLYK